MDSVTLESFHCVVECPVFIIIRQTSEERHVTCSPSCLTKANKSLIQGVKRQDRYNILTIKLSDIQTSAFSTISDQWFSINKVSLLSDSTPT